MENRTLKKILLALILLFSLTAYSDYDATLAQPQAKPDENAPPKLTFVADFYDNNGDSWLSVEGSTFNISPNKVKEYSWDSDGSWISQWTMSSVMTVEVDGNVIQTCGSTVIFSDTALKKYDIKLPTEVDLSDNTQTAYANPNCSIFFSGEIDWSTVPLVEFD